MVFHFANSGQSRIGNSRADPPADIILNGLSIQPSHALLENDDDGDRVTLTAKPGAGVKINGVDIKVETELHHNDRFPAMRDGSMSVKNWDRNRAERRIYIDNYFEQRV